MSLPVIRVDLANHGVYGSVIYAVSAILLTIASVIFNHFFSVYIPFLVVSTLSLLIVVLLALAKDLIYDKKMGKGVYDSADIWYTIAGGAINHIIFNLGYYFITVTGLLK